MIEVGQHETEGDLTVRHSCPTCRYAEEGPRTPSAAKKTSPTLAALLLRLRLEGVEIPLVIDDSPFPEVEW